MQEEAVEYSEGGSMLVRFFLISGIVVLAFSVGSVPLWNSRAKKNKEKTRYV